MQASVSVRCATGVRSNAWLARQAGKPAPPRPHSSLTSTELRVHSAALRGRTSRNGGPAPGGCGQTASWCYVDVDVDCGERTAAGRRPVVRLRARAELEPGPPPARGQAA